MMTREQLVKSPEYWLENVQNELYAQVIMYMRQRGINDNELAGRLGITQGEAFQLLKDKFDGSMEEWISISIAIGQIPMITYSSIEEMVGGDQNQIHRSAPNNVKPD